MKNPRMIMPLGMACLVLAITWPSFSHPVSRIAQDWSDGFRGLLYGLSIGLNLMAVYGVRQRRCRNTEGHQSF